MSGHGWKLISLSYSVSRRRAATEKCPEQVIVGCVSTLIGIFFNLRNCVMEQTTKTNQLAGELFKVKTELMDNKVANHPGHTQPSRGEIVRTTRFAPQYLLPPSGGPKKFYSEAVRASTEPRCKLMVKSKLDLSTEEVKIVLRMYVNPTVMNVGFRTLKSLKDGRILIEAVNKEEINKLS